MGRRGQPIVRFSNFRFFNGRLRKNGRSLDRRKLQRQRCRAPGTLRLAGSTAGRGDEAMTINPFDLTAIAGFMAVGLWLETVGGKHGFVDEFFAPIPLAATGCIYAVFRSLIY
jgi:hypothetical protein